VSRRHAAPIRGAAGLRPSVGAARAGPRRARASRAARPWPLAPWRARAGSVARGIFACSRSALRPPLHGSKFKLPFEIRGLLLALEAACSFLVAQVIIETQFHALPFSLFI